MKRGLITLILTLLACVPTVYAQCYGPSIREAKKAFEAKNYTQAKSFFMAAAKCPDCRSSDRDSTNWWIARCDEAIKNDIYINGHEFVDLGLSVKWATCNVGADKPSDWGDYYAWGEIETKSEYTEDNSLTYRKKIGDISGNPAYDAARALWDAPWRMPTHEEIVELVEKCKWKAKTIDGHRGYEATGPSGKSIFIPYSGSYNGKEVDQNFNPKMWSSTPHDIECAYSFYFRLTQTEVWSWKYCGMPIRPVSD